MGNDMKENTNKLLDKLIICALCIFSYIQFTQGPYVVVPVICAVFVSGICSYFDKDFVKVLVFALYSAACIIYPYFLFFLPLICYDIFSVKWRYMVLFAAIPVGVGFIDLPVMTCIFIVVLIALAFMVDHRTVLLDRVKSDYMLMRDNTKEFSLSLESKNKELLEKQDYDIHLATLNERNRIARDIHDNIGHLLSNSILQTGALMAICKDEALRQKLNILKDTLAQGMDSIRESIHDLHDESVDLYTGAMELVNGFHFCEISMDYDVEANPERNIKYALLAVIKEALSNIIRHSDATSVKVTLREHPALYQLIIRDNGSKKEISGEGIGLKNIQQRVNALKGNVNINNEKGFTVFISIPKESAL